MFIHGKDKHFPTATKGDMISTVVCLSRQSSKATSFLDINIALSPYEQIQTRAWISAYLKT
ncbi:hypothetical protein [Virgibacillus pantothenticus]|uniref:hypothetical protein n=1 Tax=Virgibacillus pantothenticus TaxID=1473 RepID=UPI0009860FF3|nr:hypothetical protein [Virgibacillus pantothenticus]